LDGFHPSQPEIVYSCVSLPALNAKMRLLNAKTIKLEEFNELDAPPYAILSHTWDNQEVTFQDIHGDGQPPAGKAGYQKIIQTCQQAMKDGIKYVWVDTCCINKTSSAELSEAINSMFRWYENAQVCYAFLSDVPTTTESKTALAQSRWFTRGWTLQELIAPRKVVFFASSWMCIDTRGNLAALISTTTRIGESFLIDNDANITHLLKSASVAQRMSWASGRQTTRPEDQAYCLLGIFGINMPLLYGEGNKAFIRLQEEIIRHTDDQSIFAWISSRGAATGRANHRGRDSGSVLASSPAAFAGSEEITLVDTQEVSAPFSITNRGIRIDIRTWRQYKDVTYGLLHCRRRGDPTSLLAIPLVEQPGKRFARLLNSPFLWEDYDKWRRRPPTPAYLITEIIPEKFQIPINCFVVKSLPQDISLEKVSPGYTWYPSVGLIMMHQKDFPRLGAEATLDVVLKPTSLDATRKPSYDLMTVSIKVRWLYNYNFGPRWVTYDVNYSCRGRAISKADRRFIFDFARVKERYLFGQKVTVIEILPAGTMHPNYWMVDLLYREIWFLMGLDPLWHSLWLMWLNSFLSHCLFGTMDGVGWQVLEDWLQFALIRPAALVVVWLALWSPRVSQLSSMEALGNAYYAIGLPLLALVLVVQVPVLNHIQRREFKLFAYLLAFAVIHTCLSMRSPRELTLFLSIYFIWGEPLLSRTGHAYTIVDPLKPLYSDLHTRHRF
jgi:hypothetical protein